MKVGYLHIGPEQHGVRRYGRMIAAEARQRPDLSVSEAEVALTGRRHRDRLMLDRATAALSSTDLVHIQYNQQYDKSVWGPGWSQLAHLARFMRRCGPPLVATLHDVYPRLELGAALTGARRVLVWPIRRRRQEANLRPDPMAGQSSSVAVLLDAGFRRWGPHGVALRRLLRGARALFVSSQEEARRLTGLGGSWKVNVVPHFVERRRIMMSPSQGRADLKLEGGRIVTLLGVIHRRKGYQLMVEAMRRLPEDVTVVFAGRPAVGSERFLKELWGTARSRGVAHRLRVTGYLPEDDLERYIVATHLAVCPFQTFAASGSLSTWISAGRPILASNLPQMAEYNRLVPRAIRVFEPYTAAALAEAIAKTLPECSGGDDPGVARLRERLSISAVFDEHLAHYRAALTQTRDV